MKFDLIRRIAQGAVAAALVAGLATACGGGGETTPASPAASPEAAPASPAASPEASPARPAASPAASPKAGESPAASPKASESPKKP